MIAYGPVPSRRLGQSLGINNIPPKICSYSCVYCQVGKTIKMQTNRQAFFEPDEIHDQVVQKINLSAKANEPIDYLTFVPDGEPTLDINLGREILLLKPLGKKIAVITNSSLLSHPVVREELSNADWVSLKIDCAQEQIWRKINRPHRNLKWSSLIEGIHKFSKTFQGQLVTETMLIQDLNDNESCMERIGNLLAELRPDKAYLAIPTRPAAENWVRSPREEVINRLFQSLNKNIGCVEYLIGYEGNSFAFSGNIQEDLLSITAVHPMRQDGVETLLAKAKADWSVVSKLIERQQLIEVEHDNKKFYMRKIKT